MTMAKRSKKNILLVLLLTCILSATLVILRVHITSASEEEHNIAVECIFPVTYPRWDPNRTENSANLTFGVAVNNTGDATENFTLTLYNLTEPVTLIGEKDITLDSGAQEIIKFTLDGITAVRGYPDDPVEAWDGTGYFTHEIKANATTVEGETITEDNSYNTTVSARWDGDVDGNGHINVTDVNIIDALYDYPYIEFPDANYIGNVSADLNLDGIINFDDIIICAVNQHGGPLDIVDIEVTGIFNVTFPTWNDNYYLTFGVTVRNNGWGCSETFYVTIYNGTNLIGNETVTDLASKAEKIVKFTLQGQQSLDGYPDNSSAAWPYPKHTIKANTSVIEGDDCTENNEHGNVTVTVSWPGDANGDGHVNQTDAAIIQATGGKDFPDANYTAWADFNGDGLIDLNDTMTYSLLQYHNGPIDYCDLNITLDKILFIRIPCCPLWNPSYVYPGWDLEIYVIVENNGNNTEAQCTLKAYANTTIIGTKLFDINLAPNTNTTVHFTATIPSDFPDSPSSWSYPYPFYNIKVNATLDCDRDKNSTNNEDDSYGTVTVRCPGDTDGDGCLNETDLSRLSGAIEVYAHYADFNGNWEIDLDDVQYLISDDRWKKGPED